MYPRTKVKVSILSELNGKKDETPGDALCITRLKAYGIMGG